MKKVVMICALSCVLLTNATSASLTLDIDESPDSLFEYWLYFICWISFDFTLERTYTVTDVMTWMNESHSKDDITVVVPGDGGDVSDTSSELYGHTFYSDLPTLGDNIWDGVEDVCCDLGSGSYWDAFEVHSDSANFAFPDGLPFSIDNYTYDSFGAEWVNLPDPKSGLGVLKEEPVVISAPGALLLSGLGLGVVSWLRRRRTR